MGRQKSLSQPDFPFRCSLKHTHIEIVRDLNLTMFSIQVCLGVFFLNHLDPPSKGV